MICNKLLAQYIRKFYAFDQFDIKVCYVHFDPQTTYKAYNVSSVDYLSMIYIKLVEIPGALTTYAMHCTDSCFSNIKYAPMYVLNVLMYLYVNNPCTIVS